MITLKTKAKSRRRSKDPLPKDVIVLEQTARKARDPYERGLLLQRRSAVIHQLRSNFRVLEGGLAA